MKIYFASRVDLLFSELEKNLTQTVNFQDPFIPEIIVTPNQNIATYLKLEIAKRSRIAINIEFPFPETALQNLYRNLKHFETTGQKPPHGFFSNPPAKVNPIRFASQEDWQSVILHNLLNKSSTFFDKYLGDIPRVRERKAWELSKRLATYFREYRYHRPDFFKNGFQLNSIEEQYKAQLELLQQTEKDLAKLGLTDFFSVAPQLPELVKLLHNKQTLRLFATSQFSCFHTKLLLQLSREIPVELYQIRFSDKIIQTHQYLQSWSKASQQGCQLIDHIANEVNIKLQQISLEKDTETKKDQNYLSKIKFLSASSIRKEVEQIAEFILQEMRQDISLSLNDIAVLCVDINRYWPHIQTVFHQSEVPITFNLTDASAATGSSYAKAALTLLKLVTEQFSRENLFHLFYNPCFLAKFSLSRREVSHWFQWTEELNAYAGSASEDFYAYPKGARDWQTALERLRLGLIMEPILEIESEYPLPHIPGWLENRESLYTFCSITEELRLIHSEKILYRLKGSHLLEKFSSLLDDYLSIPEERPFESEVKRKLQEACLREAERQKKLKKGEELFNTTLLKNLIRDTTENIPLRIGRYLGSGVSVSSLLPMRPVPFKVIFIAGMNDSLFPRQNRHSRLDLRTNLLKAKEKTDFLSDISKRDTDLQLFSEILFACEKYLYLSYLDLDIKKDIRLLPAEPYRELQQHLNEEIIQYYHKNIKSQPQNHLISQSLTIETKPKIEIISQERDNQLITTRDILDFLNFPLNYWLKRINLNKRNEDEESERRSYMFEATSLARHEKKKIIIDSILECFEQKILPNEEIFTREVLKRIEKKIQYKEKSFQAPFGLFLDSELEQIRKQGQLLANSLASFSDIKWQNFRRIAYGETAIGEPLTERRDAWGIPPSNFYFCGLSPLYYWEKDQEKIKIIHFNSDGFVTYIKDPQKIHIKLKDHLTLLSIWLPLMPLFWNKTDPIILELLSISKNSTQNITKNGKNFEILKSKIENLKCDPKQAKEYAKKIIDLTKNTTAPDAFHVDSLKDMQQAQMSEKDILKYRRQLQEIWQNKDSSFSYSLKFRNPITDILPLWLRADLQNLINERYAPLFTIITPIPLEKTDKENNRNKKSGKTAKK